MSAVWLAESFRQARHVSEEAYLSPHFLVSAIELPKLQVPARSVCTESASWFIATITIIITVLIGAFISIFPNQFKAPQGCSFDSCYLMCRSLPCCLHLLYRSTFVLSVIIGMRILKVLVNGPLPKTGGGGGVVEHCHLVVGIELPKGWVCDMESAL